MIKSIEGVRPVGVCEAFIDASYESDCLRMQSKSGGKLHLRLNTCVSPIANKYREGKLKRTLKRELNSTWNRLEVNEWSRSWCMEFSCLYFIRIWIQIFLKVPGFDFLLLQSMHFPYTKTATNRTVSLSFGEADQFFGIGCIALSTVESMYWYWRFANFDWLSMLVVRIRALSEIGFDLLMS